LTSFYGTDGADTIAGTAGADVIWGGTQADPNADTGAD
jgi:Ca2+-binding RTX toxin-like protein